MTQQEPIRVMIVDDHLMVRDGLKVFLSVYNDLDIVGEASDGQTALEVCKRVRPDVILMDIIMPNMDGPTATRKLRAEFPTVQVIALTSFAEKDLVQQAIRSGAIAYVLKDVDPDKLADAIRDANHGKGSIDTTAAKVLLDTEIQPAPDYNLTQREQEILALVVKGKTNGEIAGQLTLSVGTVRFHVSNILSKLGVSNRTEASSLALKNDLVEVD